VMSEQEKIEARLVKAIKCVPHDKLAGRLAEFLAGRGVSELHIARLLYGDREPPDLPTNKRRAEKSPETDKDERS